MWSNILKTNEIYVKFYINLSESLISEIKSVNEIHF